MGVSRSTTQSPKGYDLQNLTAPKLGLRLAAGATATLRDNIRTAMQDQSYRQRISPEETLAGLVEANLTFGTLPGDLRRYGGIGDGATNNDTALTRLRAVMAQGVDGYIPKFTFAYTTSPNFALNGACLRGERGAILKHTGAGVAFNVDAGGSGARVDGLDISSIIIQGNATTTDIFYARGVCRSKFSFLEARTACTGKAFHVQFNISTLYLGCGISNNLAAITTNPAHGLYATDDGTAGNYTANCSFVNFFAEGITGRGGTLHKASGNVFLGGTFEGCGIGIDIDDDECRRNHFVNTWCEANTTQDMRLKGVNNTFTDCYTNSAIASSVDASTAKGTIFRGGFHRCVNLQATTSDTVFEGVGFSDNGALGITGTGLYKAFGCNKCDTSLNITSTMADVFGVRDSFTSTLTGCTTSPTGTVKYSIVGDLVTCAIPAISGTSNTTAATLTGWPVAIRPAAAQRVCASVQNNTSTGISLIQFNTDGTVTLFNGAAPIAANFTAAGTKGIDACTVTYRLTG